MSRAKKTPPGSLDPTDKSQDETKSFKAECEELKGKFDDLLPQIMLAKVDTVNKGPKSEPSQ